jgi:hypothetical protein
MCSLEAVMERRQPEASRCMRGTNRADADDIVGSRESIVGVVFPPAPATHSVRVPLTQSRTPSIFFVPIIPVLHSSPRAAPRTRSIHLHLFPRPSAHLPFVLLSLQPRNLLPTRPAVVHPITPNQVLRFARVHTLAHFSFAIEVRHANVKAVDVGRDDGQDEHDAVEDEVLICAGDEHHGHRWEEDVAEGYY